jgi:hypothetical protein
MKIIAHRGNVFGPDKENENRPEHIESAINLGFDVEIDVWVKNNEIYFGHDNPTYLVNHLMIHKFGMSAWFHCKNLQALEFFIEEFSDYNYFWHQQDSFTLTSKKYVWTYPGMEIGFKSIIVLPETINGYSLDRMIQSFPYGLCTDYADQYKSMSV